MYIIFLISYKRLKIKLLQKALISCILSDLFAVYFNMLTFVNKILTTSIKNEVNVYF